jgi:hypothetical protein
MSGPNKRLAFGTFLLAMAAGVTVVQFSPAGPAGMLLVVFMLWPGLFYTLYRD